MSKYLMNKLIHLVNMDEKAEEKYCANPRGFVEDWEKTQKLKLTPEEREALATKGFKHANAEITMIPQTMVKLEGKQAESMLKMMDKLEDNDDVQNVYANFDISMEEMEKLM